LATTKLTALTTVQWVPAVDAAGIATAEGVSSRELLAEVAANSTTSRQPTTRIGWPV